MCIYNDCARNDLLTEDAWMNMAWLVGYPREKINWHPTIDPEKCVKCGMCMNCGRNVYDWTEEGPVVARPNQCIVGCNTCANLCMGNAISFPEKETIREIYKREKIWSKVKKQLEEEGKIKTKQKSEEESGCCDGGCCS